MKLKRLAAVLLAGTMLFGATATVSAEEKVADEITIWAWDEAFNIKAANVAKEIEVRRQKAIKFLFFIM